MLLPSPPPPSLQRLPQRASRRHPRAPLGQLLGQLERARGDEPRAGTVRETQGAHEALLHRQAVEAGDGADGAGRGWRGAAAAASRRLHRARRAQRVDALAPQQVPLVDVPASEVPLERVDGPAARRASCCCCSSSAAVLAASGRRRCRRRGRSPWRQRRFWRPARALTAHAHQQLLERLARHMPLAPQQLVDPVAERGLGPRGERGLGVGGVGGRARRERRRGRGHRGRGAQRGVGEGWWWWFFLVFLAGVCGGVGTGRGCCLLCCCC